MSAPQGFVGIDVAKAPWDIALRPTGDRWAVPNAAPGMAARVARLQATQPTLMVREATGGSHRAVIAALAVAHCAEAVRPAPRPRPDAQTEARRALLAHGSPCLRTDLAAPMAWRKQRVAAWDDARDTTLRARPVWRARETLYRRVPGIGPVCARPLVCALPAWGTGSRQRSAALVGVAPFTRDSGPLRGTRTTWGGRAHVRATVDMRPLVAVRYHPVRTAFYARLCTAGTAKKVARTACMRTRLTMLNAMAKPQKPWHVQEVPSASQTRPP